LGKAKRVKRLDLNNVKHKRNFELFLRNLDSDKYRTDFDLKGSCNYAFNLAQREANPKLRDRVEETMRKTGVEFRRGNSSGDSQLRQAYLRGIAFENEWE